MRFGKWKTCGPDLNLTLCLRIWMDPATSAILTERSPRSRMHGTDLHDIHFNRGLLCARRSLCSYFIPRRMILVETAKLSHIKFCVQGKKLLTLPCNSTQLENRRSQFSQLSKDKRWFKLYMFFVTLFNKIIPKWCVRFSRHSARTIF